MYLLQKPKEFVGNNVLWRCGTGGYTTDVSRAKRVSKIDAEKLQAEGSTNVTWPENYIATKTRPVVNRRDVDLTQALAGTGIVLVKPKALKRF